MSRADASGERPFAVGVYGGEEVVLEVPRPLFAATFDQLRRCGSGRRECQVLWIGAWKNPTRVASVVHPEHRASSGGFVLDDEWLTAFSWQLAKREEGIWAQVHTHPSEAFHSATDDAFPIVQLKGFLSLVIPDLAMGPVSLRNSYLAEIGPDGEFTSVEPTVRLRIV